MNGNTDSKIVIGGKTMLVSSTESAEVLQKVAEYINGKLDECSGSRGYEKLSLDMRNMLLLLNVGEDYINTKEKADSALIELAEKNKEIYEIKQILAKLKAEYDTAKKMVNELQGKAADNAARIIKLETELKKK